MLSGRLGASPVMIGRQPALARLRRLADDERFALALVNGEAGIGKTRLLRELSAEVGRPVLAGQADPTGLARPLGLVLDLLPHTESELDPAADALEAVRRILALVGGRPSVVVFEDLHWADAASVEVFERLAERRTPGMLLIGTYRTEDLTRRLPGGDMLARLERRHDVERVHLQRLDRAEVAAFLTHVHSGQVSSFLADAMYERTGGNPFFLEELAGCCGDISPAEFAAQPLPWSLEEVVRRQLDGISPEDRRLAEAAAILGVSATFDVLADVAELDEETLLTRLRSLVQGGLLEERTEDHFVFRHALVRDAVEQHLLGRERRQLHQRALDRLAALPSPPLAELARHAQGAGRFEAMVEHARSAAVLELRQRGSSHLALRLATEALAEQPDDAILLEVATEAAWLVGFTDEAVAWADRLMEVAITTASSSLEATALRWMVRLAFDRDDRATSDADLKRLAGLLDRPLEPTDRARTLAALAQASMLRGETDAAVEWADQAIELATALGADDVRVQALVERGSALSAAQPERGWELEAAAAEAEACGLWVLATRGFNNLFDAVPIHTPHGREVFERFQRAANHAGFDAMTSIVTNLRSTDLGWGLGDIELAEVSLARAEEWLPLHRHKDAHSVELYRVWLEVERNHTDGASQRLQALTPQQCVIAIDHDHVLLELRLLVAGLHGDRAEAIALLDEFARLPLPSLGSVVVEAVESALLAGVDAASVRSRLVSPPTNDHEVFRPWRRTDAILRLVEARLDLAAGDRAALDRLVEELASPAEVLTAPTVGRLWTVVGEAARGVGRYELAADAVAHAHRLLARWTGWRLDRLADLEAALQTTAVAAPAGPFELTTREREVAALVALGLSNGEIATRLYISRKTASVHVSNILAKLGFSNRTELAAWAIRQELVND